MHTQLVRVLAVLFLFSGINTILAEDSYTEEWRGKIIMPGKEEENVTFDIRQSINSANKDKSPIKIKMIKGRYYEFDINKIVQNELLFNLDTGGTSYECILDLVLNGNGQYSGSCDDSEDKTRKISFTMFPLKNSNIDLTRTLVEETVEDTKETDEEK